MVLLDSGVFLDLKTIAMNLTQFYLKFLLFVSLLCPIVAFAQPDNDLCDQAIDILDLENFCSNAGSFSNEGATASNLSDGELSATGRDVWFRFTASASHVTITIRGFGTGGTLLSPEVQLFRDNQCGSEFQVLDSEISGFSDIAELNKGGLTPGASYLFRVQGSDREEGTFQLCINNYFPPQSPGSDIDIASFLCDKSPFVVQQIDGAGLDDDEADGTCLDVGGIFDIPSEQSSTWFTWIAANNGTLEFTLDPLNPLDDIDFVLFELPNGVNNGAGKISLRCMATACEGPTGLNASSVDFEEDADCDPGEDGFVRALTMEEGKVYGLLINNFSESGNGFTVEFGGTGEFQTPEAIITPPESDRICLGIDVSFDASSSSFTNGEIVSYEWIFGVGAEPATGMGVSPGVVSYDVPGEKTVVLTVTTNLGCRITEVVESIITVDSCCLDVAIISDFTEVIVGESANLETDVTEAIGEVSYQWAPADILSCTNCPNPTITPTEDVTVSVMIMDEQGCEATDTLAVEVKILIEDVAIPSAFSPDFDGTNDRFTILGGGPDDRIVSLQIYTRWGNLIYEVENIQLGNENGTGWDGNYKGERQQPDVYIYHAVVLESGEEVAYTGDITLIR